MVNQRRNDKEKDREINAVLCSRCISGNDVVLFVSRHSIIPFRSMKTVNIDLKPQVN